jgi:ABC-2 type transport system ATP-binding protein
MWVQEALQYKARLHGLSGPEHHQHLLGLVERLGLRESLLRPIHTLSKGLRQRVALAQTLLHDPSIVILDEPTSGLDPQQTADIRALIVDLSSHATVIVATHNLHEVETLCDSVVILVQGKVALSKPLSEVLAQGHSLAQRFQSVHDDQRVQG